MPTDLCAQPLHAQCTLDAVPGCNKCKRHAAAAPAEVTYDLAEDSKVGNFRGWNPRPTGIGM